MTWKTYIGGKCTTPIESDDYPEIDREHATHTLIQWESGRRELVPPTIRISIVPCYKPQP